MRSFYKLFERIYEKCSTAIIQVIEMHRAGENLQIVKYSGSHSKYLVACPILIMKLVGDFQRIDH